MEIAAIGLLVVIAVLTVVGLMTTIQWACKWHFCKTDNGIVIHSSETSCYTHKAY
jgi:hypothetical protein